MRTYLMLMSIKKLEIGAFMCYNQNGYKFSGEGGNVWVSSEAKKLCLL